MSLRCLPNVIVITFLGLSLSGCFNFGQQAWRGGAYGEGGGGGFEINTASYDVANAPRACVNNLSVYHASLQAPEAVTTDLSRSINSYIREAGGARAALNIVNMEFNDLNGALNYEQVQREAFNASARAQSDAAIDVLEDEIFLNRALAEALSCRT